MIKNQFKTLLLLSLLTALLLWVGSLFGRQGLIFAVIFVGIFNFGSYFWSDKIVLAMHRAKEVKRSEAPKLYELVKEVAHEAGLPMPKLYILPSMNPNAFATGRNPKHAAVACTQGILSLLTKEEFKGVIAHEMAHIKNRDILISTIAAMIAGVISYIAMMARWGAIFGGFGDREQGNNMLQLLVLAILTPLIATIIQLAISRSREYLADETGARIIQNPKALASALEKLELGSKARPMLSGNTATASLFIVNPFTARGFINLFSTHPPIKERVKRLRLMKI